MTTTATQLRQFNKFLQTEAKDPIDIQILHIDNEYIIYQNGNIFKYTWKTHVNQIIFAPDVYISSLKMCDTYCILYASNFNLICCDMTHIPWTQIVLRDVNYNLVNGIDDHGVVPEYTGHHDLLFFRKSRRMIECNRVSLTNRIFIIDFTTSQILHRYNVPAVRKLLSFNPDETKCVMLCRGKTVQNVYIIDLTTGQFTFIFDIQDLTTIRFNFHSPDIYWDKNDNISFYYNQNEVLIYNINDKTIVKYKFDDVTIHSLNQNYVTYISNQPTSTFQDTDIGLYRIEIYENVKQQIYSVYKVDNVDITKLDDITAMIHTLSWLSPHALFYTSARAPYTLQMIKIPKISHGVANQLIAIRYKLAARQIDLDNLFEPYMNKIMNIKTFDDRYKIERHILNQNMLQVKDYYTKHNLRLPPAEQLEKYNKAIKHKYIKLIKKYHPQFLQSPEVASLSKFDKRESHRAEYNALRDTLLKEMAEIEIKMLKLQEKRDIAFKQRDKTEETDAKFRRINQRFLNTINKYTEYLTQKLKTTEYDSDKRLYASISKKISGMITFLIELQNEPIQKDISSRSMSSLSSSK